MTTKRAGKYFWYALMALGCMYASVAIPQFNIGYLDFGDGNYLYISSRLADGVVLYRDILAPQPPLLLFVGSLIIRVARGVSDDPVTWLNFVRSFSVILHVGTMALLALLALRLFRSQVVGVLAAFFYLIIPIGYWWNLGYQSEPLMLLFLLGGFYASIRWERRWMIAAGLLHLLAVLTNMTAAPYICWIVLFLLIVDRRWVLYYLLPIVLGWLLVVGCFYLFNVDYLGNVFFNQVGTFPKEELYPQGLTHYVVTKLMREGWKILNLDFFFILWGIVGLLMYLRIPQRFFRQAERETNAEDMPWYHRGYVAWFAFWSWMSIGFVSKGATADYIFTIGEPLLCAFAAYAAVELARRCYRGIQQEGLGAKKFVGSAVFVLILATTVYLQIFGFVYWYSEERGRRIFGGQRFVYNTMLQETYEQSAEGVKGVIALIEAHSDRGEMLVGPPYYAFITARTLYEEYSELFIWKIKYMNEMMVDKEPGEGVEKIRRIAEGLRKQEIAMALMDDQLMYLSKVDPEFNQALEEYYRFLTDFRTLNFSMRIYVPGQE